MPERGTSKPETSLRRRLHILRPYAGWMVSVVVLLFLLAFVDMAQPYFLKLLVDDVFPSGGGSGGNWALLWFILPGMGLIYVSRNTLFFVTRMLSLRVSEDLCFDLRKRLFEHLQQLSLRYYRSHQAGKISSRLMDDTYKIQAFIQDKLPTLLRYVLEFHALLAIIYLVNWRLALASTIVLPLHLLAYRHFRIPIRESHSEAQESLAVAHGNIVEKFLGMEVVKGFSGEERESRSFREAIDASRKSQIRSQRYHFAQKVVADLIVGLGTVMLLGYGAWEVYRGRMSGGAFFMFFWYIKMLYPAVLEVISGAGHLSRAGASMDRVYEMLEEPVSETERSKRQIDLDTIRGGIQYDDISFRYEPASPFVLSNVNFSIAPGEHIMILGPSGSGKSTLMSLMPRFNDATMGEVRIDGIPVRHLPPRQLRRLFGIVFQEVFLFNASIYENLRYARPDATPDEITEACRLTGADEFIRRLPDGYYTRLGESGSELSRGEKQRITLARAIVRDPRILMVDEATASIDAAAGRKIIEALLRRMEGRTVVMITHDIELVDLVDRVLLLDGGRIVYDGPPADVPEHIAGAMDLAARNNRTSPASPARATDDAPPPPTAPAASSRPPGPGLACLLVLVLLMVGCLRSEQSTRDISMDQPRISSGVVIDEDDPTRLNEIADALDALTLDPPEMQVEQLAAALAQDAPPPDAAPVETSEAPATPEPSAAETAALRDALDGVATTALPRDAVRLIALPRLSDVELRELVDALAIRLHADLGYEQADWDLTKALPAPPASVTERRVSVRSTDEGPCILRIGYYRPVSQVPQLWIQGVRTAGDVLESNPDIQAVADALAPLIDNLNALREAVTVQDLEARVVQLSYIDAQRAQAMLQGMGISTVAQPVDIPANIDFAKLPYVAILPDPAAGDTGLVGAGNVRAGEFGLSLTPNVAGDLSSNMVASPMTQLMVMFHPAHPEQFSRVRSLLEEHIDRPARQIFVEGMVLEIAEEGLEDLGIEWELSGGPFTLQFGSPDATGVNDTLNFETEDLDFWRFFDSQYDYNWEVKVRALIRTGKAEILSRPSVLTINNRQSTIRVGRDIPIATSQEGFSTQSNKIAFTFKYLATGILLNIRPRINEDGSEVSLLIDTIVSATVPGADLEIRSTDGDLLASAPTVSTRRVQTYARIRNNTPFIIGGLVSRDYTLIQDKVPLLGDLPLIGGLFRAQVEDTVKREVIIVLTPHVLPEDTNLARANPKDEDTFDTFGNELFRDSYRIRAEDVFDLRFLTQNRRLVAYRTLAEAAIERNFRLAEEEPFKSFADGRIPGEEILVTRMVYEVIKRLDVIAPIQIPRTIYFKRHQVGGLDVEFLQNTLTALADVRDYEDFFDAMKGKALALSYHYNRAASEEGLLDSEPIPHIALVDCADRDEWSQLLWDLNQPDEQGRERFTILLHQPTDLVRLRRALALKRVVVLNGGRQNLSLKEFSIGKTLLMPELKDDQVHVIDADVARYFFHTELYYAATIQEIERRVRQFNERVEAAPVDARRYVEEILSDE
jgi:ABC-type multidrug transport system fused ATPase/permease subunit/Flp pilus assembly secretin CpaC